MRHPDPSEHDPYYAAYIALVPEDDLIAALAAQQEETRRLLESVSDERASFRYAAGKWSVRQVVGHMTDAERVFQYRAMSFARGEKVSLPGFDEEAYVHNANFDKLPIATLADGLKSVRRATIDLFRTFDDEIWGRSGVANEKPITVRALAFITLGHERHHLRVLRERYLTAV
jgi:hypothetical protein